MPVVINGDTGIDLINDGAVVTADLANGAVTTAKLADTSVTTAKMSFDSGSFGFRNKIIGGDFTTNPWQRGTSFTAPATTSYTADRWRISYIMDGVVNVLKTADAPTASEAGVFTQHCLHVDVTTADTSIAAGQYCLVQHFLEGLNVASFGFGQAGTRYVTLSFWHKHTKTGTYCVSFMNSAGNRSYVAEYTQDVSDTWEKATITIPVDTTGTWLYDNGVGVRLAFPVAGGSTFQTTANTWAAGEFYATANQVHGLDSTSNNFKIALVQMEFGQTASPFESRPYGTELALCQRYYYRITPGATGKTFGNGPIASNGVSATGAFPVTMRVAPSALEQSGTANQYAVANFAGAYVCNAVPTHATRTSQTHYQIFASTATALTDGQCGEVRTDVTNGANAYLGWSAEL